MAKRLVRMGIDVGGTHTKAVALDNATHEVIGKSSVKTTHDDEKGVAAGVVRAFQNCMKENNIKPEDVVFVAHSTTQATNALLEGDVANVGIIGIAGGGLEGFLAKRQCSIKDIDLGTGRSITHRWVIIAVLYGLLILVGFLIHRFDHSRLGRAASAVFVDKDLAGSLGIDIRRLGMLVQTASCTIAGGCGVLYGFIYKSFHLDFFTFALVGIAMTIIFVGGYATMWGSVVLAPILYGVPLLFPSEIQSWRIVIYGALLILVLVLKPEGFITRRFVLSIESFLSGNRRKRNTS